MISEWGVTPPTPLHLKRRGERDPHQLESCFPNNNNNNNHDDHSMTCRPSAAGKKRGVRPPLTTPAVEAEQRSLFMLCLSEGGNRVSLHTRKKRDFLTLLILLASSSVAVRKFVLRQRQVCPSSYEVLFFSKLERRTLVSRMQQRDASRYK